MACAYTQVSSCKFLETDMAFCIYFKELNYWMILLVIK